MIATLDSWRKTRLARYGDALRALIFGSHRHRGVLFTALLYTMLATIAFVYLYPLLYMFVTSIKSPQDLLNPMVQWLPNTVYVENYVKAYRVLDFPRAFGASLATSVIPSLIQTAVCSLAGYGLARYRFPGKRLIFVLLLATFIIPPQNTVLPQMLVYKQYGLLGNILSLILPALLGQGIRSAIFIFIFYQSFSTLPPALEESARIDGASEKTIFLRIAAPNAIPAYIVSVLFSVVWYWNETFLTVTFLEGGMQTLPMQLTKFVQAYESLYPPGMVNIFDRINEAIKLSGTFLNILPLLIFYFILQRWFVESVERTGITGE
ncbi:MAG: carbohydrate ABC transporter permease [Candidatus Roseilinea sp.]|uniref:carbohydrate ABC transporter permease n=1 Tax=Candidatus Roseilinea sp. TaxID=2838777 RepID=UPI00404A1AC1